MFRPKLQIKRSKYLPFKLEQELRRLVFDAGEGQSGDAPQLIIGNSDSCCHGVYHARSDGVEFIFHHNKLRPHGPCACFVQGEPDTFFFQLPEALDEFRVRLVEGKEPVQMEPLYAAMVIMKLFLGMELPEELGVTF